MLRVSLGHSVTDQSWWRFDSNANVEYRCYQVAGANFAVDGQRYIGYSNDANDGTRCQLMVADAVDVSWEKWRWPRNRLIPQFGRVANQQKVENLG